MPCRLVELLRRTGRPRILVTGDVMLDRYVWGDVDRISPEGPIPVLKVVKREERLGGAGSVVAILAALETDVSLASLTADDPEGGRIRELLGGHGANVDSTLVASGWRTTIKERLLGSAGSRHPQQMMRVDTENARPIGTELTEKLLRSIESRLDEIDVVLVSDYDKGVCSTAFIAGLVKLARQAGVPVLADPAKNVDFRRYAGCTCLTPNRIEAGLALGVGIETSEKALEAARRLLCFEIESAVLTLDRDGIAWADTSGRSRLFPVQPRQVYDVTGAGDMVLAALGFSLAAGADWPTMIDLANLAAGMEVERLGVSPLTRAELLAALSDFGFTSDRKIVSVERLEEQLRTRRQVGQRIVMTNGCFDLLHPGHVASLRYARSQGDCLVVGINSDRSVEDLKGAGHPIIDQQGRAEILANMECVDYVVIFDEVSVAPLVERVVPDVLVKSAQYATEQVVGHQIVQREGGRVVLAPMNDTYSTSRLIGKIQANLKQTASDEPHD